MKSKKSNKPIKALNVILIGLIFVFVLIGLLAHRYAYFGYDLAISRQLQSFHNPIFSTAMILVSEVGNDHNLEIIVVLAMSLLFFTGLKAEAVKTALLTVASATAGSLAKSFINRPRPDMELVYIQGVYQDKSFPSLHVLTFTVFFGYMLYLAIYKVRTKWLQLFISLSAIILILTIGISRIYLGAHWASDVAGGYLLGAAFLILAIILGR
ncbi:TPA: hypothetical protein DIU27_00585 [Candidatus Collierbacteria bacterium]|uniref:Membrane-associated phospholipid phosphatase n=1 Tax=Candidatus Collierbacteria bacterium GW2011_GWB2_44_22 TaxID=1618387 RepID=A0A0G1HWZ8_9BACT|nr:MAG: Membrane-associated phospholipid phosphatase [Candidatus Collierbacteria bacterium GW2011_GWA2_44_13]KKT51616.1 MAG: Membrane-associated phospholipid phosphatase [Candidatus Collierbacteria bacterium GW2011_GWB2_44_22]KKT63067.1 MAG: Membrane-associated phospholipid phosphatase [Candidatus Collierbacteria bacterium GW2011_GWD1_44_27]KKT66418.1 MAG: Membrane-associated phospholipid phosphatase [Candidatus Collierbacteria bacterium GW2011_GWC2_44_30]KKT68953.1 MAG: phosphoesterase PA-phos